MLSLCFHSDREDLVELNRFLEQSLSILSHFPVSGTVVEGLPSIEEECFEWPFLCLALGWDRHDGSAYEHQIQVFPRDGQDEKLTAESEVIRLRGVSLSEIEQMNQNPFHDRRSFLSWWHRERRTVPVDFVCTLHCDIRKYTLDLVDAKLLGREKPVWDPARRELRFADVVCISYKRDANCQIRILARFQERGWPRAIYSPLDSEQQAKDAVDNLKARLGSVGKPLLPAGD